MDQFFDGVQKKRIYNTLMVVSVLLAVFLAALTLNALKSNSYIGKGTYPTNVVSVTGTGEVLAVPDIGSFSFSVVEEGKTVGAAQDLAAKKINAIIDAVKSLGVEEKDIQTSGYNSYPKYDYSSPSICTNGYCPPAKQILTGYEVNQTVTVKVRKTADSGAVLTKVGDLGAQNISGLDFIVDDLDTVKAEARDKAVEDAKAKAKVLAKSLGVKLDKIVSFMENGDYPMPYYSMDAAMGGTKVMNETMAVAPQLPVGENKITSTVTITYEIK